MKTEHTPGPWEMPGQDGDSFVICTAKSRGKRRTIAHAYTRANARLIASAPETAAERDRLKQVNAKLLAALREFVAMFIDTKLYPDPGSITTGLRKFLPQAQAAIAKAEGGGDDETNL